MREQGFFSDLRHEMYQLRGHDLPRRADHRRHALHMGEMSWDEAVAFMTEHTA